MTEGFVLVFFPRWIRDPKKLYSRPNFCFLTGDFSYIRVSCKWCLPWNNFKIQEYMGLERVILF